MTVDPNLRRKEVKPMKYNTPELTRLAPAIEVIETSGSGTKAPTPNVDGADKEVIAAYADWE
jgi:hypothetical protein